MIRRIGELLFVIAIAALLGVGTTYVRNEDGWAPNQAERIAAKVAAVERVVQYVGSLTATSPTCGAAGPDQPTAVLSVTANQCLSCRNLGYLLREAVKVGNPAVWVFTSRADAHDVCAKLRIEKVSNTPVFAVTASVLPDPEIVKDPLLIWLATQAYLTVTRDTRTLGLPSTATTVKSMR